MNSSDRLTAIALTLAATIAMAVIGLGFHDCHEARKTRAECFANPMRSAAECTQAFPERRGQ